MPTWTQAEIDTLKAAIASGVQTVAYADRTVTYQSLEEMRALLASMEQIVSGAQTTRYAAHDKGV
jgi:hypothetical protein